MRARCTHVDQVTEVTPRTLQGCEECLAVGGRWVHLRLCLTCESWAWCYADQAGVDLDA